MSDLSLYEEGLFLFYRLVDVTIKNHLERLKKNSRITAIDKNKILSFAVADFLGDYFAETKNSELFYQDFRNQLDNDVQLIFKTSLLDYLNNNDLGCPRN